MATPDQIRTTLAQVQEDLEGIVKNRDVNTRIDATAIPLVLQIQQLKMVIGQVLDLVAPKE
jgi:hypothetical protein